VAKQERWVAQFVAMHDEQLTMIENGWLIKRDGWLSMIND